MKVCQLQSNGGSAGPTWAYDGAARLSALPDGTTLSYDNADELTGLVPPTGPATTYSYDGRGNRTTKQTGTSSATYSWDQANRLTSFTAADGSTTTYTYDGEGLRATKKLGGSSTEAMTWDQVTGSLPLLLTDTTASYIYGPDGAPIEQIQGGTPTWLLGDQLDSTRLITNSGGTVSGRYDYDPYGEVISHTGSATTFLQFNGQYTDAESGLIYLRARKSSVARWRAGRSAGPRGPVWWVGGQSVGLIWGGSWSRLPVVGSGVQGRNR